MQPLRFLFSSAGTLRPWPFALGIAAVYAAGVASQWLTMPAVIMQGGIWPFLAAQALLVWIWFSLHAKRLRDAGRSIGLAAGAAALYALAIVLLVLLVGTLSDPTMNGGDPNTSGALAFILFVWIVGLLSGSPSFDFIWFVVAALAAFAFVPVIVAAATTLWAATRPSGADVLA